MAEPTDAQRAIAGVKGTARGAGVPDGRVLVDFTDDGWEAAKRVLTAQARDDATDATAAAGDALTSEDFPRRPGAARTTPSAPTA